MILELVEAQNQAASNTKQQQQTPIFTKVLLNHGHIKPLLVNVNGHVQVDINQTIYQILKNVRSLYVVAPQKCLENLKHHPRIHCFDSKMIEDHDTGISSIIEYAYHGRQ